MHEFRGSALQTCRFVRGQPSSRREREKLRGLVLNSRVALPAFHPLKPWSQTEVFVPFLGILRQPVQPGALGHEHAVKRMETL